MYDDIYDDWTSDDKLSLICSIRAKMTNRENLGKLSKKDQFDWDRINAWFKQYDSLTTWQLRRLIFINSNLY